MGSRRGLGKRKQPKKPRRRRDPVDKPKVKRVSADELKAVVQRARGLGLAEEDCQELEAAIDTLAHVFDQLDSKNLTLARLRALFGLKKSEKTKDVFGQGEGSSESPASDADADADADPDSDSDSDPDPSPSPSPAGGSPGEGDAAEEGGKAPKGHGRHGAADYTGGEQTFVPHPSLKRGDPCPDCGQGKVYEQRRRPRVLIRVTGQPPLKATVVKLQTFRCNLCGKIFSAPPPDECGDEKYDARAKAMIALLKYAMGLPFYRLAQMEERLGIPLPASTQWELVRDAAKELEAVYKALLRHAAQGEIFHNDDTSAKILTLLEENKALRASGAAKAGARTGIFTTGIVSIVGGRQIALFFTGRQHAGENAAELLQERAAELGPPIQMCDALDRNLPGEHETLLANCLAHARRKFVDVAGSFPDECRRVLEAIAKVYKHDKAAKARELTPEQRLELHPSKSGPVMAELEAWLEAQLDQRLIEPNSTLGDAIRYVLNHWEPLTLFLRVPGAPLDNNACERILKRFILLRKNSYFYKTEAGAEVGNLFLSLIHTAELNGVNPFDSLTQLLLHAGEATEAPAAWLPWNYPASPAKG